jgi:hypothetical protein
VGVEWEVTTAQQPNGLLIGVIEVRTSSAPVAV